MKIRILSYAVVAILILVAGAFAITTKTVTPGQPVYQDGVVMQNNAATAPLQKFARTGTTAVNKGRPICAFNLYSGASWFKKADVCVTNSTGVAQPVRYYLGSNTASMISPTGCFGVTVNREYTTVSVAPFSNASGASATTYYWSHQRE
jgi:hypothetical protein